MLIGTVQFCHSPSLIQCFSTLSFICHFIQRIKKVSDWQRKSKATFLLLRVLHPASVNDVAGSEATLSGKVVPLLPGSSYATLSPCATSPPCSRGAVMLCQQHHSFRTAQFMPGSIFSKDHFPILLRVVAPSAMPL